MEGVWGDFVIVAGSPLVTDDEMNVKILSSQYG